MELKKAAIEQYGANVDVKNIIINGSFSALEIANVVGGAGLGYASWYMLDGYDDTFGIFMIAGIGTGVLIGNTQKITAVGDVVLLNQTASQNLRRTSRGANTGIEGAVNRASNDLVKDLPEKSTIAIINISSNDRELSSLVLDELEFQLVDAHKFTIVDRKTLDTIRTEQHFQMSGEVSDSSAVSIGEMLGANIVITGSITGSSSTQRLSIKALDVRTAQIVTMVRESF
jgi:TolB-like protein